MNRHQLQILMSLILCIMFGSCFNYFLSLKEKQINNIKSRRRRASSSAHFRFLVSAADELMREEIQKVAGHVGVDRS